MKEIESENRVGRIGLIKSGNVKVEFDGTTMAVTQP
jgi:hypothetical protein